MHVGVLVPRRLYCCGPFYSFTYGPNSVRLWRNKGAEIAWETISSLLTYFFVTARHDGYFCSIGFCCPRTYDMTNKSVFGWPKVHFLGTSVSLIHWFFGYKHRGGGDVIRNVVQSTQWIPWWVQGFCSLLGWIYCQPVLAQTAFLEI